MTTVVFPSVAAPVVSIVMVTYGGFDWVLRALKAVADHTDPCYEVVVVDNDSPDGTGTRLLDEVEGASIIVNHANVGFGAGANQGAAAAVGRYVFFLNSDAFVHRGWLPPLLAVADGDPDVGAVASCLVDPDGTLQEAGGLVGANGYAGQLGMGADRTLPEFRFRRQVDFASAAALLVRRDAFLAVGGFHPAFVMGYFEDVDLCLELARRGLRTVYEPASVVTHLRGASTEPGEAARRATVSHAVFVERWAGELDRRPPIADLDDYPHRLVAARDFLAADRVLVVCDGSLDEHLVALLQRFAACWPTVRFTLLAAGEARVSRQVERLTTCGIEVAVADVEWDRWLSNRRFHYSSVFLVGGAALHRFDDALRRTQPQAARVQVATFIDGPVDVELAGLRAADAVLCLSERAFQLVRTWGGVIRAMVLPPSPTPPALDDLMAALGIAPPATRA